MRAARIDRADLTRVNLQGADLSKASLRKSILVEANLRETWLCGAGLSEANLKIADLNDANLSDTNSSNWRLDGAHNLLGQEFSESCAHVIIRDMLYAAIYSVRKLPWEPIFIS